MIGLVSESFQANSRQSARRLAGILGDLSLVNNHLDLIQLKGKTIFFPNLDNHGNNILMWDFFSRSKSKNVRKVQRKSIFKNLRKLDPVEMNMNVNKNLTERHKNHLKKFF